ncbi:flavin adenine dinucleotide pyrophosphatase RNJ42_02525 [Nakaseomyces bracarensis]|uniref:flavin adenine dinucleotide pyrophosphatase n=1 Tax=Nakaseomyces bracarensis TaxID=273131 RepID=UPI00387178B2
MFKSITKFTVVKPLLRRYSSEMGKVNAACLIIGDEILNGKVVDLNSTFFAKFCYHEGIALKSIMTVGDDEDQIVRAVKELSSRYDFIVTTGGIGPTHDDITYASIAKSFDLPCKLDEETKKRMQERSNPEKRLDSESLKDYYRMATLPTGNEVKKYYVADDLWVPICAIKNKVYILPGIPQLFERMLTSFLPTLKLIYDLDADKREYVRYFVKTKLSESEISRHLRTYQSEADAHSDDIKIGSYPHFGMGFNTISILGVLDDDNYLRSIRDRAIGELEGEEITEEEESEYSNGNRL